MRLPVALTIAGSDSGGGAGIQADLKTFGALGCHGTSAVTAVTAQDTRLVSHVVEIPPEVVRAQVDLVVGDLHPAAAKTGMLASAAIVEAVSEAVRDHRLARLVVDPVMVAKGGSRLLNKDAAETLRRRLLPLAEVLTPN
ncbi:MAG: bifunctional hydroxymethylpyrimidine kinase/phosphomethylpyrimidine kinase, partial [Candidatus Dormibacterales bacterium]